MKYLATHLQITYLYVCKYYTVWFVEEEREGVGELDREGESE